MNLGHRLGQIRVEGVSIDLAKRRRATEMLGHCNVNKWFKRLAIFGQRRIIDHSSEKAGFGPKTNKVGLYGEYCQNLAHL